MKRERVHWKGVWQTVHPSLPLSLPKGVMSPGLLTLPSWYSPWQLE